MRQKLRGKEVESAPEDVSDTAWENGEAYPREMSPTGHGRSLEAREGPHDTNMVAKTLERTPKAPRGPFQGTFVGHKLLIHNHAELRGLSQNCRTLFKAWCEHFRSGRVLPSRKTALLSME